MYDVLSGEDKRRLFEKELRKFAYDIEILCALESGGKLEAADAYKKIKAHWKRLKGLKKDLLPKEESSLGDDVTLDAKQSTNPSSTPSL